ncbi:MAG: RNA chaperone Hfq [Myxacorys californica WJT36-NPBG1]|jgi:host factor-I protein|nr:RNA chaperone Hfq [Myxacorys californica WJT36-NPBG1]
MALDLDTGLPSTRQIQTIIREETEVEMKLTTGDVLTGKVRWQDTHCICLLDPHEQPTIIWRQAIAFIKPKL